MEERIKRMVIGMYIVGMWEGMGIREVKEKRKKEEKMDMKMIDSRIKKV